MTVHEAQSYPRHKACGEFISGLSYEVVRQLGLEDLLAPLAKKARVAFFAGKRRVWEATIPKPVFVCSRHELDARLARAFVRYGGELRTGSRLPIQDRIGQVIASGRRKGKSSWLGLKVHLTKDQPDCDLELHVGKGAYVGFAWLPDGRVNACALLQRIPLGTFSDPLMRFAKALEEAGLEQVAARLLRSGPLRESMIGVSHFDFGMAPRGMAAIGDSFGVIPPFTGNGMAMALESALLAADLLEDFALGKISWDSLKAELFRRLHWAFRERMFFAGLLHHALLSGSLFQFGASQLRKWDRSFPWIYQRLSGYRLWEGSKR